MGFRRGLRVLGSLEHVFSSLGCPSSPFLPGWLRFAMLRTVIRLFGAIGLGRDRCCANQTGMCDGMEVYGFGFCTRRMMVVPRR